MYRIALCEDSPELLQNLHDLTEEILTQLACSFEITVFSDGRQLAKRLHFQPDAFDLLLLDIDLGEMNGMEIARQLRQAENKISIIFTTGLTDYLLEGYEVMPIRYLIKPISKKSLQNAIETDMKLYHQPAPIITFHSGKRMYHINPEEIIYIESLSHALYVHLSNKTLDFHYLISNAEKMLQPFSLFRCHKSFIVNLKYIDDISHGNAHLKTGESLPISRSYKETLQKEFINYLNAI